MPSFQSFITFLASQPDLQNRKLEALHDIIFRSPETRQISLKHLAHELNVPLIEAYRLVEKMVAAGVISISAMKCPQCGDILACIGEECPRCKMDLLDVLSFSVDGCMAIQDQVAYLEYSATRAEAERFAEQWLRQGYIYYLLVDLAESENLQEQDSQQYNEFLEDIRNRLKSHALSQARMSLCLGEIGDCIKLAFLTPDDAIATLINMTEIIRREGFATRYTQLVGREVVFPRFDGTLGKVPLRKRHESPRNLLCVTLSGSLDFNDYELTRLFRFDQAIKTDKKIYKSALLTAWIQDEVLSDLDWDHVPTIPIVALSHGSSKTANFGLLSFPGVDGEIYSAIKLPQDFKSS